MIVVVYNGEKTIREALKSVINQGFENLEIIVVNDYSTDNTVSIIENEFVPLCDIKIHHNKCNMGPMYNYEYAVRHAQGKYILMLDADDIYLPNAFTTMYNIAEKHGADVIETLGFYITHDQEGPIKNISSVNIYNNSSKNEIVLIQDDIETKVKLWCANSFGLAFTAHLFSAEFLNSIPLHICRDGDVAGILKCVIYAKKYIRIPYLFYVYRMREISDSHSVDINREEIKKRVSGIVKGFNTYIDLINNCDELKSRPELHQLIQEHYLWIVKVNYINKYYVVAENNDDVKKWIIESLDECFYPYGEFMNCLFKKYFLES